MFDDGIVGFGDSRELFGDRARKVPNIRCFNDRSHETHGFHVSDGLLFGWRQGRNIGWAETFESGAFSELLGADGDKVERIAHFENFPMADSSPADSLIIF